MDRKEKIVLINPPLSKKERYDFVALSGGIEPPHGLCYLAGAIRQIKYPVEIIDAQALNLDIDGTLEKIKTLQPSIVGFTAVTALIHKAGNLAEKIKTFNPEIITIIGGVHISGLPKETMERFRGFDIGIIGEGEIAVQELIRCHQSHKSFENVNSLVFRKKGVLFFTKSQGFIENLDDLPYPAYDLLPKLDKYYYLPPQNTILHPSISIITSRGCPFNCRFCDHSVFSNKYRSHGAEYVVSILENLKKNYGVKNVFIQDDTFLIDEDRAVKIVSLMIERQVNIKWGCHIRPDTILSKHLLKLMRLSGCWSLNLGIETCSPKILEVLGKKFNIIKMGEALQWYKEYGFVLKGLLMIGNPLEDEMTLQETLRCIKALPLDDISIAYFTPYPATEIYNNISNYGEFNEDWKNMSSYKILFIPKALDKKKLEEYFIKFLKSFYLRPKIIFNYIFRLRSWNQFLKYMRAATVLFR